MIYIILILIVLYLVIDTVVYCKRNGIKFKDIVRGSK